MKNKQIYGVLLALVIWIFGSTYWIVTNFCPSQSNYGNNQLSTSYKSSPSVDALIFFDKEKDCIAGQAN